jgi:hypothetical protein
MKYIRTRDFFIKEAKIRDVIPETGYSSFGKMGRKVLRL